MVRKRRQHTAAYKFRVALEAVEGSKTISQLSSEHEVHANLIRAWKQQRSKNVQPPSCIPLTRSQSTPQKPNEPNPPRHNPRRPKPF